MPLLFATFPTHQHMSSAEARRKSISLDCDTVYFSDVLGSFRDCASGCGSSFYFEDEEEKVRPLLPRLVAASQNLGAGSVAFQPSSDVYKLTHALEVDLGLPTSRWLVTSALNFQQLACATSLSTDLPRSPLQPIFSYIEFESGTNRIVRIREKEAISRHANTGAYAFPCGDQLRSACRKVLDNPVGRTGEFYTSSIIEGMIRAGQKVLLVWYFVTMCRKADVNSTGPLVKGST